MWRRSLPRWSNILKRLSQTVDVWVSLTFSSVDQILRLNHQTTALTGKNFHSSRRKLPSWAPNTGDWAIPKVFFSPQIYSLEGWIFIHWNDIQPFPGVWVWLWTPSDWRWWTNNHYFFNYLGLSYFISSQKPLRGKGHRLFVWHGTNEATTWSLFCLRRLAL